MNIRDNRGRVSCIYVCPKDIRIEEVLNFMNGRIHVRVNVGLNVHFGFFFFHDFLLGENI